MCEKCQDKGFTEQEHGLVMVLCDCEKGKAMMEELTGEATFPADDGVVNNVLTAGVEATYTGMYFQLLGKRTDECSTDELWKMCKEASLEKVKFPHIVIMPCNNPKTFLNAESILNLPIEDIPCPCGNPNHYIVRFIDNREVIDDSSSGTGQPDKPIGSKDTSQPKRTRKPKKKKGTRKRAS